MTLLAGGEPFHFPGGETGCLLIHGFTATPREMRLLGERLASDGYTVLAPRLFGHATHPDDLARARRRDWLASAADGYSLLAGSVRRTFLIGMSLGGSLALLLARQVPCAGLVLLSTPFALPSDRRLQWLRPILRPLSLVWRHAPKGPPQWFDPAAGRAHLTYPVRPLRALAELDRLLAEMRRELPQVRAPTLLVHSRDDHFVPPHHMTSIHDALGSAWKEVRWIEGSSHGLTQDAKRNEVFAAVEEFLSRVEAT
ncbi:MAG: alpha/beta hydrolase, partial [Anaerolineales bacterium]